MKTYYAATFGNNIKIKAPLLSDVQRLFKLLHGVSEILSLLNAFVTDYGNAMTCSVQSCLCSRKAYNFQFLILLLITKLLKCLFSFYTRIS